MQNGVSVCAKGQRKHVPMFARSAPGGLHSSNWFLMGLGGGEVWPGGRCSGREAFPVYFFIVFDFATSVNEFPVQN